MAESLCKKHVLCFLCFGAVCMVLYPCDAAAAPAQDIRRAQSLMEQGAASDAIEMLNELLVDYPESPEVRFAIGCAWYMQGEQRTEEGNPAEASEAYKEARNLFTALQGHDNAAIAQAATFNHANCLLRAAALIDPMQQYAEAVAGLRLAVEAYERAFETYPEHGGIQANLDHARYLLKQLLQQPPEQEEQPDEQPPEEQPQLFSRFGRVGTEVDGAQAREEDDMAILIMPEERGGRP